MHILKGLLCKSANGAHSLAIGEALVVVETLALHEEDDDIEIKIADSRLFEVSKTPSNQEILQKLRQFRSKLPADFYFDRDELHER